MKRLIVGIAALSLSIGANVMASYAADDVVIDDSAGASAVYTDADVRDRTGVVRNERTRVYGWSYRPLDCGVFHYWNGTSCVDSRDVPPDIGPK